MATLQEAAVQAAQRYGVPPSVFVNQINYESGFQNIAGASGEFGPGQFMPDTWRMVIQQHPEVAQEFGVTANASDRGNAVANIFAAAAHMGDLLRHFGGDIAKALAGYNAGAGNIGAGAPYAERVLGMGNGNIPHVGASGLYGIDPIRRSPTPGAPGTDAAGFPTEDQGPIEVPLPSGRYQLFVWDPGGGTYGDAPGYKASGHPYTAPSHSGSNRLSFAEQQQMAQQAADLEIAIHDAEGKQDTQQTLILLAERDRLDQKAREAGWAHDDFQAQVQREFDAKQADLSRENQQRISAQQEIGATTRALMETSQRAKEALAQMAGEDPLRAAVATQGGVLAGRTPSDVVRSALQTTAYQGVPNTPNPMTAPLPDVQAAVQNLQNRALQPLPSASGLGAVGTGFAGGGTVTITKDDLTPTTRGPTGVGVLVGEKGPEVMEVTDSGVRVIPILQRAAGGVAISTGSSALDAGVGSSALVAGERQAQGLPAVQVRAAPMTGLAAATPSVTQLEAPARAALGLSPQTGGAAGAESSYYSDILGRWPTVNYALDVQNAQRLGLTGTADALTRLQAGLITAQQAYDIIKQQSVAFPATTPGAPPPVVAPPGGSNPVTTTPEQQIAFVDDLTRRWPFAPTDARIAQTIRDAENLGMHDVAQVLWDYAVGTLDQNAAFLKLQGLIPGVRAPAGADQADPAAMRQAIQLLWQYLGISQPPITATSGTGSPGLLSAAAQGTLAKMGIMPRFYRNSANGQVFIQDNEGKMHALTDPGFVSIAELQHIPALQGLGFDPANVLNVTPQQIAQMGISDSWVTQQGGEIGQRIRGIQNPPSLEFPSPYEYRPLVVPGANVMIPAFAQVAPLIGHLDPAVRDLLYQAYKLAGGYSAASLENTRSFYTPHGTGSASRSSFIG